jgi:GrpB-like predicted nucleotidyltransferase (UPF0157 family)
VVQCGRTALTMNCALAGAETHRGRPLNWVVRQHKRQSQLEAPVHIEPYNPAWPTAFLAERDLLVSVLERWLVDRIEHVGSTAVPGLAAKPIIDIMAPVKDLEFSRPALGALQAIGYCYAPYKTDVMHWLCKPSPELRTHHLHLVPWNSKLWIERLAFRDLLIADRSVAKDYAALKSRLAATYRHDRERYTEEKGPFIETALRRAVRAV